MGRHLLRSAGGRQDRTGQDRTEQKRREQPFLHRSYIELHKHLLELFEVLVIRVYNMVCHITGKEHKLSVFDNMALRKLLGIRNSNRRMEKTA
jgi:hypothetical protein